MGIAADINQVSLNYKGDTHQIGITVGFCWIPNGRGGIQTDFKTGDTNYLMIK